MFKNKAGYSIRPVLSGGVKYYEVYKWQRYFRRYWRYEETVVDYCKTEDEAKNFIKKRESE